LLLLIYGIGVHTGLSIIGLIGDDDY